MGYINRLRYFWGTFRVYLEYRKWAQDSGRKPVTFSAFERHQRDLFMKVYPHNPKNAEEFAIVVGKVLGLHG